MRDEHAKDGGEEAGRRKRGWRIAAKVDSRERCRMLRDGGRGMRKRKGNGKCRLV